MKLRSTAPACLVLALLATGCTSFRSKNQSAATVGAPSIAETKVAASHLVDIGDLLRAQGQHRQAAEMYRLALQRDPGNAPAKNGLNKLPVAFRTASDSERSKAATALRETPPPRKTPFAPRSLPAAPPVQADGAGPSSPAAPGEPLDKPTITRRFEVTSRLPKTLVEANQGFRDEHVIQIIPASKAGKRKRRELRFDHLKPETRSTRRPQPAIRKTSINSSLRLPSTQRPRPAPTKQPQPVQPASASQAPISVSAALSELTGFADFPQDHVGDLAARLGHSSSHVRVLSVYLLGRAGLQARGQVGRLRDMLKNEPHGPTRMRIAEALARIAPGDEAAGRAIAKGLQSPESAVRWEAVCVAGVMRDHAQREAVLGETLARLEDSDPRIREMAALVVGDFQRDRVRVIGALKSAAGRTPLNPGFHDAVATTLAALRSYREPVPALRPDEATTASGPFPQAPSQPGPFLNK
ncbi:MAG: hypothetical protein ACE5KM_00670 [Planctomycetaceae bacterium]